MLITHKLDDVFAIADDVAVMLRGRIVARLGGRAGPPASRERRRRMTASGASPEAKHASASRRRAAQE
ncbi:MAG: hypothetical protein JHC74_09345 [Thermoleophilia bacterium]|nr:hypothetical protein [Thermoleophilia bacterium]